MGVARVGKPLFRTSTSLCRDVIDRRHVIDMKVEREPRGLRSQLTAILRGRLLTLRDLSGRSGGALLPDLMAIDHPIWLTCEIATLAVDCNKRYDATDLS